jgi:hypothetical protein
MRQESKDEFVDLELGQIPDIPAQVPEIPKRKKSNMYKRLLLIFVLLPLLIFLPVHKYEWNKSLYFVIPTSIITIYVLLLNFPSLIAQIHSCPLYYEDLEDDRYIDPSIKLRFQIIFVVILQITLTLIISGMIYYYYDQFHITDLSKIEIFGVLGGFISLLFKIENIIGKSVLTSLNMWKKWSPYLESDPLEKKHGIEVHQL